MVKIEIGNYFEVKKPLIYLEDEIGEIIWFYDYEENIVCLEIIGINFPRWVFCIQTREEMIQNAKNSIKGGKNIEFLREEFKKLIYEGDRTI
jgi:hypothetical protein